VPRKLWFMSQCELRSPHAKNAAGPMSMHVNLGLCRVFPKAEKGLFMSTDWDYAPDVWLARLANRGKGSVP
jgi:hypothetical protein